MEGRLFKLGRWLAAIILTFGLFVRMVGTARGDDAEDKLGNWMGVNSSIRFSDHWSLFGQGEVRFWEVASDLNETLFRIAGHYDINKIAMAGKGDEIRSYSFHGLMMGMLLGAKSFSFLVASVKLCV